MTRHPDDPRLTRRAALWSAAAGLAAAARAAPAAAANPIVPGWYADPEIRVFGDRYWIYATASDPPGPATPEGAFTPLQRAIRARRQVWPVYLRQTYLDAFSSPDLVRWTHHPHVLDVRDVAWAADAVWAPSVIEAGGRFHILFGANDIQKDGQLGGLGLAVADAPAGPFRDELGRPLIGAFHNGAQPIDPFAFRDADGAVYLYYGGWGRCNVVRLSADLRSVEPLAPGVTWKDITPPGYVEGSFVIRRRGVYYLMWSEGDWTTAAYRVAYATGPGPLGPFTRRGVILQQDPRIARGAGHHSVVNPPGTDDWFIVYHRRPLGDADGNHRQLAIDRMRFAPDGAILPVRMSVAGAAPQSLHVKSEDPAL